MCGARHKVNQLAHFIRSGAGLGGAEKLASFFVFLTLNADQWLDAGDQLCQTRLDGTLDDERHVLVRSGRLL